MKTRLLFVIALTFVLFGLNACTGGSANSTTQTNSSKLTRSGKTMRAFGSEFELKTYLRQLAEKQKRRAQEAQSLALSSSAPMAEKSTDKDESVTNVQHAGVDEGGIVKVHGNHLVVLRRGRLFTVDIGDGALKPISSVNAFGPDIDPQGTWYDEMLVSEDTVVVIGYSYQRGGTEVGLFKIDRDGELTYQSTYHLRSNDYYSSRNYASRLIGNKLIFYTPLYVNPEADPGNGFPAVRRWHKGATNDEFRRIVAATRVYRPERPVESSYGVALHTVTVCDLSNGGFSCEATGVIGPWGRVFYVSPQAVYVWVTEWANRGATNQAQSMLYRMPLDGSAPSALGVSGSPIDQFSFLESEDNNLNVLVRSDGAGDAMWNAERKTAGSMALMRVPIASFSDGSTSAASWRYRELPQPGGYTFQNRFVADYLLYGTGSGWGYPRNADRSSLYAVRWAGGDPHELALPHGVDRIEALGSDAVVVGTDGKDLHFSAIRLGETPEVRDRYTRPEASQGELRSHGFFYKPDGTDSGMIGLPISVPGRPGYRHLFDGSASILFLRNSSLRFQEIGELASRPEKAKDDGCRASCVDWYGNARPLFVRGRIFALLGYEIVEGRINDRRISETRRISYAPNS